MCLPSWSRVLSWEWVLFAVCLAARCLCQLLPASHGLRQTTTHQTTDHRKGIPDRQQRRWETHALTPTTGRECRTGHWSPRYEWGIDLPTQWLWKCACVSTMGVGVWSPRYTRGALTSPHRAGPLASPELAWGIGLPNLAMPGVPALWVAPQSRCAAGVDQQVALSSPAAVNPPVWHCAHQKSTLGCRSPWTLGCQSRVLYTGQGQRLL